MLKITKVVGHSIVNMVSCSKYTAGICGSSNKYCE